MKARASARAFATALITALIAIACLAMSPSGLAGTPRASAAWGQVDEWALVNGQGGEGIAVGAGGEVFVTRDSSPPGDPLGDDPHVLRFSGDGKSIGRFGAPGTGPGQLESPGAIATDAAGRVYVDDGVSELEVFTGDGSFVEGYDLTTSSGDALVTLDLDIEAATGDLYVSNGQSGVSYPDGVARFSSDGAALAAWGGSGSGPGQFSRPESVAYGNGSVYVVDNGNHRIQRFSPDGAFLGQWGGLGSEPAQFVNPLAVAVDPGGDVFVADSGNDRVQQFTADGALVDVIPRPEDESRSVTYLPIDLDFDSAGRMYVLNNSAGESDFVHVFASGGSDITVPKQKLRLRNGKVKVKLTCSDAGPCAGKLSVRKGKAKLAKASYKVPAGKTKVASAKLTGKGRRLLANEDALKVTVELRPVGGGEKVKRKLTLVG